MTTRTLLPLLALIVASLTFAADWPCLGGPAATSHSSETGLRTDWAANPPKELWRRALSDDGYAGPSVAGGTLFVIDHVGADDIVLALDVKTGVEIWRHAYPDTAKANYGFSRATPTVDGNRVYIQGRQGYLACLDVATGKPIWTRDLVKDLGGAPPRWLFSTSPLVDGDSLIVLPGGANLVAALDAKTGAVRWQSGGADGASYGTPSIATLFGVRQYVVWSAAGLQGLDPATGARLWKHDVASRLGIHCARPVAVGGDKLFVTTGYGVGCLLLDLADKTPKVVWTNDKVLSRIQSPIYLGGNIYCTGEQKALVCLDPATGAVRWSQPGFGWGGMLAIDGKLLVMDEKSGDLALATVNPEKYEELARITPLGAESRTAPVVTDGLLLVRNKTSIAVLNLK
jgi:outer membrane protein assembly factor BamB